MSSPRSHSTSTRAPSLRTPRSSGTPSDPVANRNPSNAHTPSPARTHPVFSFANNAFPRPRPASRAAVCHTRASPVTSRITFHTRCTSANRADCARSPSVRSRRFRRRDAHAINCPSRM